MLESMFFLTFIRLNTKNIVKFAIVKDNDKMKHIITLAISIIFMFITLVSCATPCGC